MSPEEPQVLRTLADVLDYRPSFDVIALHAPVGLLDEERPGGRTCDSQVRRLLGARRGAAIMSAPSRRLVVNGTVKGTHELEGLSAVAKVLLPRYREVMSEILPYRQRSVFEVHPEATFHQLNEDKSLKYSKNTIHGRMERRPFWKAPSRIERVLDAVSAASPAPPDRCGGVPVDDAAHRRASCGCRSTPSGTVRVCG
jgi:predicted RNase H-like nuclease